MGDLQAERRPGTPDPWIDADLGSTEGSAPRRRRSRPVRAAIDRDHLAGLGPADAALTERLQGIWDSTGESAIRYAEQLHALAPSWRDPEGEGYDEDEAEAEVLAIALALRCTRQVADRSIRDAHTALAHLPRSLDRLRSGELPAAWFERVLLRTRQLEESDLAAVDAAVARWPLSITAEQFQRRLSHLLGTLESRRPVPAHESPEGRRRVDLLPAGDDGIGCLQMIGPIPEILAFARRLDTAARAAQQAQRHALAEGEVPPLDPDGAIARAAMPASLARLRYALLTGARLDMDGVPTPEDGFRLNVTVPVMTLLGASDQPGTLDGTIPVPASMARELAGSSSIWHRVLTDPASGEFLPLPADRYRPTRAMQEHLRLRNATCAVPGCTRPSSWAAENDHIEEYDHAAPEAGGLTAVENLHRLCWQHHRAKTAGHLDPVRLPPTPRRVGMTEWEIHERARAVVADDTDLATPATVEELTAAWRRYQEEQERRAAAEQQHDEPPPDLPPPF